MITAHVYLLKNNEWTEEPKTFYPVEVSKTLDESLDSGTVRWYGRTEEAGIIAKPFSKLKLEFIDDDGTTDTRYFFYTDCCA